MYLAIDIGNSRAKAGFFEHDTLVRKEDVAHAQLSAFLRKHANLKTIVCDVSGKLEDDELTQLYHFKSDTTVPFTVSYQNIKTLGSDRLAAVYGAWALYPGKDVLIIDAGTAITFEVLDHQKGYLGGAISPGVDMRLKALHNFTGKLPLVAKSNDWGDLGKSTEESIRSGVMNGALDEMEGFITRYKRKYPEITVLICGGDCNLFERRLKPPIFALPDLVLYGLYEALRHSFKV